MTYKVMGITAGRKNSNSEILLKEALMACEEAGAQITMVNLSDYTILDCTGCTACTMAMSQGKNAGCVLDKKDDKKRIMDVMLDQDAVREVARLTFHDRIGTHRLLVHRGIQFAKAARLAPVPGTSAAFALAARIVIGLLDKLRSAAVPCDDRSQTHLTVFALCHIEIDGSFAHIV